MVLDTSCGIRISDRQLVACRSASPRFGVFQQNRPKATLAGGNSRSNLMGRYQTRSRPQVGIRPGQKARHSPSPMTRCRTSLERLFRCLRSARQRRKPLISYRRTLIATELVPNRCSHGWCTAPSPHLRYRRKNSRPFRLAPGHADAIRFPILIR